MTWAEEIAAALEALGGFARYEQLYEYIQKRTARTLTEHFTATIRNAVEKHSSHSDAFDGKPGDANDLFYSVEGKGKGIWGLRRLAPKAPEPIDLPDGEHHPDKVKQYTTRVLRETDLARSIKLLHHYECQICGRTVELLHGQRYAEAHHIQPLGKHDGPDVPENIVCVCPTHHVLLDLAVIPLAHLRTLPHHEIGAEYIAFHNALYEKNAAGRR